LVGSWFPRLIKYLTILQVSFRNRNAYLAEVVGRSLFLVVILFIFFQLWNKVWHWKRNRVVKWRKRRQCLTMSPLFDSSVLCQLWQPFQPPSLV